MGNGELDRQTSNGGHLKGGSTQRWTSLLKVSGSNGKMSWGCSVYLHRVLYCKTLEKP